MPSLQTSTTSRRTARLVFAALWWSLTLAAHAQVLDPLNYTDHAAVTSAWRAIGVAPPAQAATDGGIAFAIPFDGDLDRVYWDRNGSWDLTAATSIEIELTCPEPSAMRSFAVYFRSGDGWYIWNRPLNAAGRQTMSLLKTDFSVEGKPSGWNAIDTIRISPWKGRAVSTTLTLHRLAGQRDRIYLVQATDSAPNATERAVAKRTTERMSRWLKQGGVPHAVVTEDQLASFADGASTIVLPYNPKIPPAGMPALNAFVERGGQLMVFYSSDEALANLMQVTLGPVTNTRDIAQWRGMALDESAPPATPERIHQQSWSIGPVRPANEQGRVIARWMNAHGKVSDEPAIVASPRGYWFSHILLDDDQLAKQRLLAGLLASRDESLWKNLADHALRQAGRLDGWTSTEDAMASLSKLAGQHVHAETLRAFVRRIGIHDRIMRERHAEGAYREAVEKSHELNDLLMRAYGLAQMPAAGEFRGVWDHDGTGWYPGDWDRTARLLADSGINAIFINSTWAGLAHYPSDVLPGSFTLRFYGDQLEQCIKAARRHGLEVHAWIVCWTLENAPVEFSAPLRQGKRLQHGSSGNERLWMNPAHPDNVRHHLAVIEEILTRYDVDGIHLDYIRYPDSDGCFSPYTRAMFEKTTGAPVAQWPGDVQRGGGRYEAFTQWRAGNITAFVRQARQLANRIKPSARLSAAVWGGYPQIVGSIGQDWGLWMREGLLDFVCPMNYANDLYSFTSLLDRQMPLEGVRGKLYPGLGINANESQLRGDQAIEQVLALRQRGVNGFMLFDLSQTLVDDVLPALRMGTTKPGR